MADNNSTDEEVPERMWERAASETIPSLTDSLRCNLLTKIGKLIIIDQ